MNCGTFEGASASAKDAARTTAAHSSLVVSDTSSCRFANNTGVQRWIGGQILAGPAEVAAERTRGDQCEILAMSHDGYARRYGLIHHRTLILADDGARLDGRDELREVSAAKPSPTGYAIRFHLHPSIKARANAEGDAVRLDAPEGEAWLFEASAELVVEPSILFASAGGPRPTTQIKIATDTAAGRTVSWSFQRLTAGSPRR